MHMLNLRTHSKRPFYRAKTLFVYKKKGTLGGLKKFWFSTLEIFNVDPLINASDVLGTKTA